MRILLTNDDGIDGEGLIVLASALQQNGHEVLVVAPDKNNSAVSHKLTMYEKVYLKKRNERHYAVSGSPADCVLMALCVLHFQPDIVLSGINCGLNVGSDVLYSGTVAGAMEGAQNGIPSIALSQRLRLHMTDEERTKLFLQAVNKTCERLQTWATLAGEFEGMLNVNFPSGEILGETFCHASKTLYRPSYHLEGDGYLMDFNPPELKDGDGDIPLLKSGFLTITPLKLNNTDYEMLKEWKKR